jgi:hypothetical protein
LTHLPTDPTAPREPVRVPRSRPGTVTAAAVIMLGGAVVGFLNGVATIVASPGIGRELRARLAARTTAPLGEIDDLAASLQALFFASGSVAAVLALVVVALAVGVLRANISARFAAVVIVVFAVCCGSAAGFGTLGASAGTDLTVTLGGGEVGVGEALGDAVPGWFASLTGGLGCVQVLGYIAVVVLLVLPASNAYFRRRPSPSPYTEETPTAPPPAAPPPAIPPPVSDPTS